MTLFLASLSLLLKAKLHACPMILYENEFYFVLALRDIRCTKPKLFRKWPTDGKDVVSGLFEIKPFL